MNKWTCSKCINCKHEDPHTFDSGFMEQCGRPNCECPDYQPCGIEHIGNAPCECSVVKLPDISRRHTSPSTLGNHPEPLKHSLAKGTSENENLLRKMHDGRRAHKATDELLDDEDFDTSLAATRGRLELSLAIASEIALRKAKAGCVSDGAAEYIQSITNTYRILANTAPQKDPSELSEAELAAAAGKK